MRWDDSIIYDSEEKVGERTKARTGIEWAAVMTLMVVLRFNVTVAMKGYGLYWGVIGSVSLEDKMVSIRAKENYTTFDRLPETYMGAVLSVEDHRFHNRPGIDMIVTGRAVFSNVKAGLFVEGVSTVTQQLAKNMHFNQEKELVRKAAEAPVALDLERNYSKNETLELYVSIIYYGGGYYCVKDASNGYFGKESEDVTDYESVLLAGIPSAPSRYTPTVGQELAVRRQ